MAATGGLFGTSPRPELLRFRDSGLSPSIPGGFACKTGIRVRIHASIIEPSKIVYRFVKSFGTRLKSKACFTGILSNLESKSAACLPKSHLPQYRKSQRIVEYSGIKPRICIRKSIPSLNYFKSGSARGGNISSQTVALLSFSNLCF